MLPLSRPINALPGDDSTPDGPMVIESIDKAIALAMDGRAEGMVTNPIQKSRLYAAGLMRRVILNIWESAQSSASRQ